MADLLGLLSGPVLHCWLTGDSEDMCVVSSRRCRPYPRALWVSCTSTAFVTVDGAAARKAWSEEAESGSLCA